MTSTLDKPEMAIIPRIERTQSRKITAAISRNGEGRIPRIVKITKKIKRFHNVITRPFMENNSISGKGKDSILT